MISWEEKIKEKSVKIIDYRAEGLEYIYDDDHTKYFNSIDEMEEWFWMKNLSMPKYAFGTVFEPVSLDLEYILESACEEHAESVIDMLNGVSELKDAIDKFNRDNLTVGSYYPDYKTVVKLFID